MGRETMEFDVIIVGAGPAGLSAACRLKQLAQVSKHELSIAVLEKGAEIGAHILSGAVIESRALDELFPDWSQRGAPLCTRVCEDQFYILNSPERAVKIPHYLVPPSMHNRGNYIISLGNLCRWLGQQAEGLGVDIFPGFAASKVLFNKEGSVKGIATGDIGVSATGTQKATYLPGMEIYAKFTLFAEGSRGHLGKQLIQHFELSRDNDPQHYGIGLKELWEIPSDKHHSGLVIHGTGWPLSNGTLGGGFFLYHLEDNMVSVGLIVDLNYHNPYLSPYHEFQRLKCHPLFKHYLANGDRIAYGARAITKGGLHSLPKMVLPGALLIGCNAGTLNFAKIKGIHTAMKSGMVAAESVFYAIQKGSKVNEVMLDFTERFHNTWAHNELYRSRNFGAALHKFGPYLGGCFNWLDQAIFRGKLPFNLHDRTRDHLTLKTADASTNIKYSKPDGILGFDIMTSVYLSNTNHAEDQPCHLKLNDETVPIKINLKKYDLPEQRYCPAAVYELIENENSESRLQINAQNCIHCKVCDIKDPTQNIHWVTPEGGGGPNYRNM